MDNTALPPKVVLTDAIHPEAHAMLAGEARVTTLDAGLQPAAAARALRAEIRDAQGLIVRRPLPPDLFDGPHALRGVVRHGVGLDFIPLASATRQGLPVANTLAANANAVAEYAIAAILENARRFRFFDRQVRQGNWNARGDAAATTSELRGRTLGLVLVNVARGAVIHEPDLVDALEAGRIAGAALDVFATQPLPMDSRLLNHPRVALTPHLAGTTGDAALAMGLMAVRTQLALIRGERPDHVVNRQCYEKETS